jgi:hypothetical protein
LRSRRAGLKRMGLLALALVLALGALGVAYAAWTDNAYLQGTVETGTLDADICGVSSTFAYKNDTTGEIFMEYVYGDTSAGMGEEGWSLRAWATTVENFDPTIEDFDSVTMTFNGVFPGYDFVTDVELEYIGSVPGKISFARVFSTDTGDEYDIFTELWQMGEDTKGDNTRYGIWIEAERNGGTTWPYSPVDPLGLQLDFGDRVHISMHVFLPADSDYGSRTLNFSGQVTITQWNEVP